MRRNSPSLRVSQLDRSRKVRLKLKRNKMNIDHRQVAYIHCKYNGHLLTRKGLKLGPSKILGID